MSPAALLFALGWKSGAICAVALAALAALRSRSASDRAAMLRLAVATLLALPAAALWSPALKVERPVEARIATLAPATTLAAPLTQSVAAAGPAFARPAAPALPVAAIIRERAPALVIAVYMLGALLVLLRLGAGLLTLRRWTTAASEIDDPAWRNALRKAEAAEGLAHTTRLLLCDATPAPLSWGWRTPAILIDRASFDRAGDADAIVAHETAHIARGDWPALLLTRVAVALFWFNPLVWLVERALIQQSEEAADLRAVRRVEPAGYAASLIACVRDAGRWAHPANGMAAGHGLKQRVAAILDDAVRAVPSGSAQLKAAMLLCCAVSAPIAALRIVDAAPARAATRIAATAAPAPASPPSAAVLRATSRPAIAVRAATTPVASEAVTPPQASPLPRAPAAAPAPAAPPAPPQPMLSVDELIEMRVQGIDPDYIVAVRTLTKARRVDLGDVVALRAMGITPDRLREFTALGYVCPDDLVAMAAQGVTPAYIRALASAGYSGLLAEDLAKLRTMGITADLAKRANAAGGRLTPDELVELKLLGRR